MKFLLVLLFSTVAVAQTPVTVKSSPASDVLVKTAQDLQTQQKSLDTILTNAKAGLETGQKALQAQINKANTDLLAELKADKKYKDKFAAIDAMQKQLQATTQQAEQKFQQDSGVIQNEVNKDKALIEGLTPIVRQENNLPDTATFDSTTQKWSTPKAAGNPAEAKK